MSEIPRHWRLKKERLGLVGTVCPKCDYKSFPPVKVCPNCHGEREIGQNEKSGEVYRSSEVTSSREASMSSK
jgi:uncharacterized OB-fold protein